MIRNDEEYQGYIHLLEKELIPAMGCTEPIAIAFAAAKAKELLGMSVDGVDIYASGNVIKNVKSVVVPNTDGKKGIACAAAIGIVAGNADKGLEVITQVGEEDRQAMEKFLHETPIRIHHICTTCALEVCVEVHHQEHCAKVKIEQKHTNITFMEKDGVCVFDHQPSNEREAEFEYSMQGLYSFAIMANIQDVKDVLDCQIAYNWDIAQAGLEKDYGANIGSILLSTYGDSVQVKAKAYAAAGCDARMGGCELPVIINSGSGNQGMSASLPVIVYAKALQASDEQLYRALLLSNLATLYQKKYIGRLSAYCGAVSAGAGAGAGITYLLGGDYDHICHTVVNALAITSGMICDGAKASCAAKIATAVDAGIMGCMMYQSGKQFYKGEGIVARNIEETIVCIGRLASEGMKETDTEIIRMMMQN